MKDTLIETIAKGEAGHAEAVAVRAMLDDLRFNEYQYLAGRTANPGQAVPLLVFNWVLGLCGEAGEVAELVKKHMYHGHDLDEASLASELGDVLWYVAMLADWFGLRLGDIAQGNVDKLHARYPEGFDQEKSQRRVVGVGGDTDG